MSNLIIKQHLLPSIKWLLEQIDDSKLFTNVNLIAKDYSAISSLVGEMPYRINIHQQIDDSFFNLEQQDLIVVDEGGGLHTAIPQHYYIQTAGVEQTTFGLQQYWNYPVVLVCRSAAKLFFESQIIARGLLRKLDSLNLLQAGANVGIVGLGAMGSALARGLLVRGHKTFGTETNQVPGDLIDIRVGLSELLSRSDIVLGCTGMDFLAGINMEQFTGKKIFVSCSSSNIEFSSLLKQMPISGRFSTISGFIGTVHCHILNGGFPINFDRKQEWELFDEIYLTRKLMLEGILQSKTLIGTAPKGVMLDPAIQLKVVEEWLEKVPDRHLLRMPDSLTEDFFRFNSEGELHLNNKPQYSLHTTTPDALTKMRSHNEPYDTDVNGLNILVLPNVWSPAYDWSSLFYIENMVDVTGLSFLEIGCGTGVISVFAGLAGAKQVVAVDINPEAIRNTRLNFDRFDIKVGETFLSDGFNNIKGKFDLITWNAPYHGCKPADMLERGCADEDYHDIRLFFSQVRSFLNPGGRIIFGFSESGDLTLIESLMNDNGFRIKKKLSDWRQDYNCMLFELVQSNKRA